MNRTAVLCFLLLSGLQTAAADSTHQHGAGELLVAAEGSEVVVELTSPAANLFGFEHPPRSAAQWQRADRALATLLEPATVSVEDDTSVCERLTAQWETGLFEAEALREHRRAEPDAEQDHQEDADAGHGAHDHHEHADAEHDDHQGHADVRVTYTFTCSNVPRKVRHGLFAAFPDLSELSVSIATAQGQSAQHQHRGDDTSFSLGQ